jgi:hypothetical protein
VSNKTSTEDDSFIKDFSWDDEGETEKGFIESVKQIWRIKRLQAEQEASELTALPTRMGWEHLPVEDRFSKLTAEFDPQTAREMLSYTKTLIECGLQKSKAFDLAIEKFDPMNALNSPIVGGKMLQEDGIDVFMRDLSIEFGTVSILTSGSGAGKTTVALDIAANAICGSSFLGLHKVETCNVLYLSYDSSAKKVNERFCQLMHTGDRQSRKEKNLYIFDSQQLPSLNTKEGMSFVSASIERYKTKFVIIDSFLACQKNTDSNSAKAREVIDSAQKLADAHSAAILFIHHFNKSGMQAGSHTITDAVNAAIELTVSGSIRTLSVVKDRMSLPNTAISFKIDCKDVQESYRLATELIPVSSDKMKASTQRQVAPQSEDKQSKKPNNRRDSKLDEMLRQSSMEYQIDLIVSKIKASKVSKNDFVKRQRRCPPDISIKTDYLSMVENVSEMSSNERRAAFWDQYVAKTADPPAVALVEKRCG